MIGKGISHYKVIEKLGQGGMGEVYLAQDTKLNRKVALKFLPLQYVSDQDLKTRFKREAQAAAALNHPSIITIHDVAEYQGRPFITMEYVEGRTLGELIEAGPLPVDQAVEFVIAIADCLSLAHRKGIVHRDIKPGNIMVPLEDHAQAGRRIKIMDFGLAKLEGSAKLTVTATVIGTLAYMSPEQARGEMVDQRTDMFSLGAVLYEMLAGSPPFTGNHEAAVLYGIVNQEPVLPSQKRAEVPRDLDRIVIKMLAKNPRQRYQSMVELLADLAGHQYNPQTLARKAGADKKSIAVLPFQDISPGKQNEYLADGLTEELIMALSQSRQLRVIARTSVMQFKGRAKDVRDIGRELGISHVLEGSVRRWEDSLRVTAQLIDTANGSHLWADKFDGVFRDIFAFQEKVARQVTGALKVKLGAAQGEVGIKSRPGTKAYEYYLQGKLMLDAPTLENLDRSESMLKRALQLYPRYAAAYGSLASCYLWYVDTGLRPDPEYLSKAEESAHQALSIDQDQPDANFAIANLATKRGQVEEAFNGFSRVLQADPNHGHARLWRAILLYCSSYFEEALKEADMLLATDPFWPMAHWLHSTIRLHQGMFDAAVAEYEQVVAEIPSKLVWLALSYRYAGKMDKAWQAARRAKELDPDGILWQMAFAFLDGAEGKGKEILKYVDERVRGYSWDFIVTVYWVASFYAMARQKNESLRWLERGIDIGNCNHHWFEVDPNLAHLRNDPRYYEIVRRARSQAERLKTHLQ
jgi:serine/threonine protein kinase